MSIQTPGPRTEPDSPKPSALSGTDSGSGILDVRSLQAIAAALFHSAAPYPEKIATMLSFLVQRTEATAAYLFRQADPGPSLELEASHPEPAATADRTAFVAARMACTQSVRTQQVQFSNLARPGAPAILVSCAIAGPGEASAALSLLLKDQTKEAVDSALVLLQWMAEGLRLMLWRSADAVRIKELEQGLANAAALPELLSHASQASDLPHALHTLVHELNHWLGSDQLVLARWSLHRCRVVALSGSSEVSKRGDAHHACEMVLRAAIRQERDIAWLSSSTHPREVSPYSGELEHLFGAKQFLAAPLKAPDGSVHGAWLILWKTDQPPSPSVLQFLSAANPHVAAHLLVLSKAKPGQFGGFLQRTWLHATRNQKRAAWVGSALLIGLLLWPVCYRIKAPCELQPVIRRVVAAPFDSLLHRAFAKAGQTVTQSTLLAEMDGKEVRWRLAEAIAKQARASKQAEKFITEGDIAAARMAELETSGLEEERKLLEYRRDNLEIRAPISGVILSGDLERSEGVPLKTGEVLYEIAPLEEMLVEVWVDTDDIALVAPGLAVEIRLESEPGRLWKAKLTRISPRSELRGSQSAFICEAIVSDSTHQLRPGVKGRAKIYGAQRPLIWNVTRRAWNYLRLKLW